jgi:hypothetical protein
MRCEATVPAGLGIDILREDSDIPVATSPISSGKKLQRFWRFGLGTDGWGVRSCGVVMKVMFAVFQCLVYLVCLALDQDISLIRHQK